MAKDVVSLAEADVLAALNDSGGILKNVAQELGCTRSQLEREIEGSAELSAALSQEHAKVDDAFSERLIEQVMQGNVQAMQLFAKLRQENSYRESAIRALVRDLLEAVAQEVSAECLDRIRDKWRASLEAHLGSSR